MIRRFLLAPTLAVLLFGGCEAPEPGDDSPPAAPGLDNAATTGPSGSLGTSPDAPPALPLDSIPLRLDTSQIPGAP